MRLFVLCLFLGAVAAEAPFAGYAPSGWRPQGAQFKLPTEYGAPLVHQKEDVEISKEKVAHAAQVVETTFETTTEQIVGNEYLPPVTTDQPELDPIRVQGLPESQFRNFQKQTKPSFSLNGQLRVSPGNNFQFGRQEQAQPAQTYGVPDQDDNDSEDQNLPEDQYQNFQKQAKPSFSQNGQLRVTPGNNVQFGRQEQAPPTQNYGVPDQDDNESDDQNLPENQNQNFQQTLKVNAAPQQLPLFPQNGQLRVNPMKNFQFGRQEQAQPAQTYGVPDEDDNTEDPNVPEDQYQTSQQTFGANQGPQQPILTFSGHLRVLPANNFQFGRQEQAQPTQMYGTPDKDDSENEEPEPTGAPSSDSDDNQSEQAPNGGRTVVSIANSFAGQYYVLGPDSNLQRVMYATSQTDDDRRNMGFTAQLRYAQVEPIRGPVYAYNEQGQLVRIYK